MRWSLLLRPLLSAAIFGSSAQAFAEERMTERQAQAQIEFRRAKDLYRQGSYREAISALESALLLDPGAKDLVYNLAVVHEKLGELDSALGYLKRYSEADLLAPEREKAEVMTRRIEGAKRELEAKRAAHASQIFEQPNPTPPPAPKRGRFDFATATVGVMALAGLAGGTYFGIRALKDKPTRWVYGRDGSYDEFKEQDALYRREALLADVSFGVGAVALIGTAVLYFGRTRPDPTPKTGVTPPMRASIVVGPQSMGVQGSF